MTKHSPPDAVDNLLACRALDEPLCFAEDGHLNRIPHSVANIYIIILIGPLEHLVIGASEEGPAGGYDCGELKHVICMEAESANGQNLAQSSARLG